MGSVYQRKDGLWCGAVELPRVNGARRRRVIASRDREEVLEKMRQIGEEKSRYTGDAMTRAEMMERARALGTHTPEEWREVQRAARQCRYCEIELNIFNQTMDHKISVAKGGSDAIDNIQAICWRCNAEKADTDHDKYVYLGPKPRPFEPLPSRQSWYNKLIYRTRP